MSTEHEPSPEPTPGLAPAPAAPAAAPATAETTKASETPATGGADAYGQPISAARQAELQGYLDRWQAEMDQGSRRGPFDHEPGQEDGVRLTGADVSWLAEQSGRDAYGDVPHLYLETLYVNTPLCQYPVNGVAE